MATIKYYFLGKKKHKTRKAKTIALKNINKNGRKKQQKGGAFGAGIALGMLAPMLLNSANTIIPGVTRYCSSVSY
jgi:hypothetical protein